MYHRRYRLGISGKRVGSDISFPITGGANDDVHREAEALSQRRFQQGTHSLRITIRVDNKVAALDVCFRAHQPDLVTQGAQRGHRDFAGATDVDTAHQSQESLHGSS
jgi:hypothetical protein